jgi:hypothetical protein
LSNSWRSVGEGKRGEPPARNYSMRVKKRDVSCNW